MLVLNILLLDGIHQAAYACLSDEVLGGTPLWRGFCYEKSHCLDNLDIFYTILYWLLQFLRSKRPFSQSSSRRRKTNYSTQKGLWWRNFDKLSIRSRNICLCYRWKLPWKRSSQLRFSLQLFWSPFWPPSVRELRNRMPKRAQTTTAPSVTILDWVGQFIRV